MVGRKPSRFVDIARVPAPLFVVDELFDPEVSLHTEPSCRSLLRRLAPKAKLLLNHATPPHRVDHPLTLKFAAVAEADRVQAILRERDVSHKKALFDDRALRAGHLTQVAFELAAVELVTRHVRKLSGPDLRPILERTLSITAEKTQAVLMQMVLVEVRLQAQFLAEIVGCKLHARLSDLVAGVGQIAWGAFDQMNARLGALVPKLICQTQAGKASSANYNAHGRNHSNRTCPLPVREVSGRTRAPDLYTGMPSRSLGCEAR